MYSIIKGKTERTNIIKDEKYHNNEYFIGILPFFTTTVVASAKTTEKISKSILKETDIIYTSLFLPLKLKDTHLPYNKCFSKLLLKMFLQFFHSY